MVYSYFLFRPEVTDPSTVFARLHYHLDEESSSGLLDDNGNRHPRKILALFGVSFSPSPDWLQIADQFAPIKHYHGTTYSMVLILEASALVNAAGAADGSAPKDTQRIMAVTAGSGWSYLPRDQLQPFFGKDTVLNWSETDSLLQLETEKPGERGSRTSQSLNAPGDVFDFSLLFEDLFSVLKVGSRVQTRAGYERIVGGRSIRYRGTVSLEHVIAQCDELLQHYLDSSQRPSEFGEMQQVEEISSPSLIEEAQDTFFEGLRARSPMDVSFHDPGPLEGGLIMMLRYKRYQDDPRFEYYPIPSWESEIMLPFLSDHLREPHQLKSAHFARCIVSTDANQKDHYKVHGFEPILDRASYISEPNDGFSWIISDGQVFRVSSLLQARLDQRVSAIPVSNFELPSFEMGRHLDKNGKNSENCYNKWVCKDWEPKYSYLDREECRKEIDSSKVEAADIFEDGRLVCVKRVSDASHVAYVCRQASDSAICMEAVPDYWPFISSYLKAPFPSNPKDNPRAFVFVLALIVQERITSISDLTFKGKLALAACMREVMGRGFGLEILFLHYGKASDRRGAPTP